MMSEGAYGQWVPLVLQKGKGRAISRIFIKRPGERVGYFPSLDAAQRECDRLNSLASGDLLNTTERR